MNDSLAIVTGTSAGLGLALTQQLLEQGWRVRGFSRRPTRIQHSRYQHTCVDLADLEAVQEVFNEAWFEGLGSFQKLALVNNAASLEPTGPLSSMSLERLQKALTLNTVVPAWLMGFLAKRCTVNLRIVNISSGAASSAYPGWGAYCMSKAALRMAGQVLAVEAREVPALRGRDISVVSFAPGVVDTDMQVIARGAKPEDCPRVQKFIDLHSNNELVSPRKPAADIVNFLEAPNLPPFQIKRHGQP